MSHELEKNHPHTRLALFYCPRCETAYEGSRYLYFNPDETGPQQVTISCWRCKAVYVLGVMMPEPKPNPLTESQ